MTFYGRNVVVEALSSNHTSKTIYLQEGINKDDKISLIISLAENKNIPIKYISSKELTKLLKSDDHQGVGIDVDFKISKLIIDSNDTNQCYIYISEATYEHNVGAIIRTAECAGIQGVILPNNIKISPTVAKTSTGAVFHIPIFNESMFNTIKKFQNDNFQIMGIERGGKKYFEANLTENILLIIGGENKSLSEPVRNKCNEILEIPQFGKVNSLNMSVASSIILYERVRQNIISNI